MADGDPALGATFPLADAWVGARGVGEGAGASVGGGGGWKEEGGDGVVVEELPHTRIRQMQIL